jgi:N4-(beta-N-acetylglucosaminyl)-L-asparaginase
MQRREFFRRSVLAALALRVAGGARLSRAESTATPAARPSPSASVPVSGGAVAIASANGIVSTAKASELLAKGADPLDAAIAGVNLLEEDPNDITVGYGGIPNEDGVVQLDASVMHGPTHMAGAVGALEKIKYPSRVAKLVMERTDRVFLVGEGALRFAKAHGFQEEDLLTERARKIWLHWRETRSDIDDWLPGKELEPEVKEFLRSGGTVHCSVRDAKGDFGACTSTSGLFFKIPGRVGDSPIIGAGLYLDNDIGSAGATGRGEAVITACGAHSVVQEMGRGASPEEACLRVLERIAAYSKRQGRHLDKNGRPDFNVALYALDKSGRGGSAALWSGRQYALYDGKANSLHDCAYLYKSEEGR